MDTVASARRVAAYKAVDKYVKQNSVIGVGCGSTIIYVVERLAERVKNEDLNLTFVPTSYPARELMSSHGLAAGELEDHPKIDCTFDGADEVDEDLNVIKGGGGYLMREKVVASCSEAYVIIGDYTKIVKKFGGPNRKAVAIEVVPFAHVPIREKIQSKFGGSVKLRNAPKTSKYGPIVTDNGNFLLDWVFPTNITDWVKTNAEIASIPGVMATGIFTNLVTHVYIGMEDGTVAEKVRI